MSFTPLGDELQKFFSKNKPLKKQIEASNAVEVTSEVLDKMFGKEAAKFAKPLFLKNRTVTISCASSVMAQEIRLRQKELVKKINQKLGKDEVDSVRYLS